MWDRRDVLVLMECMASLTAVRQLALVHVPLRGALAPSTPLSARSITQRPIAVIVPFACRMEMLSRFLLQLAVVLRGVPVQRRVLVSWAACDGGDAVHAARRGAARNEDSRRAADRDSDIKLKLSELAKPTSLPELDYHVCCGSMQRCCPHPDAAHLLLRRVRQKPWACAEKPRVRGHLPDHMWTLLCVFVSVSERYSQARVRRNVPRDLLEMHPATPEAGRQPPLQGLQALRPRHGPSLVGGHPFFCNFFCNF